ncbi:MAG: hypothetical protein ABGW69_03130 [Nanoarchaeota archaeon]
MDFIPKIKSIEDLLSNYDNIEIDNLLKQISFELNYQDPILKAELTQPYLYTLEEFQKSVYLAYLALQGKKEDLRYLSEEEKTALRIKYKIEEGSDIISTLLEFPEKFLELFSQGFETMDSKDKKTTLIVVSLIVFGYLTITEIGDKVSEYENNKLQLEEKKENIQREVKLYDTFSKIVEKLDEKPQFEEKKQEALLKPVVEYPNNTLKTKEKTITHEQAKKILNKKPLPQKIEEIIEGVYIVDGIKGLTQPKTTYYLTNNQETITLTLGKSDRELPLRSTLLSNLEKRVKIKLKITKENGITKEKILENVEDYNE